MAVDSDKFYFPNEHCGHLMILHPLFVVHHFHERILIVVLLCVDTVDIWHLLGVVVIVSSVCSVKALDPFGM